MWPFKRKKESPEEVAALERLDEGTREVAAEELDKEAAEEAGNPFEPLGVTGQMSGPLPVDPDPGDERALRDVMHEDDDKH
jgi:hypothetical protein